ncbi:MAG TPA: tetratricopeptide repeat-containing glycosyltransferase family protein [Pseudolabrys sp.]|nr:tetratricopeptide repeat-containing glycosyltransferase family protein [Pseudolabrys sp.]
MSRSSAAIDLDGMLRDAAALHRAGRLAEAEPLYLAILHEVPAHFDALHLIGVVRQQQGRDAEAIAFIDRALALRPDNAAALSNRALSLRALGRAHEALACCDRALAVKPDFADAHNNRGLALAALKRPAEALKSYEAALSHAPAHIDALNNCGIALFEVNRLDEALVCFDRVLALRPGHVHGSWNRAQVLLLMGDFARGWPEHEGRLASNPGLKRGFTQPLWLGDAPLAGRTILLRAEQGLGDTIQFCRYAPMVAARGARVVLEVQRPLVDLMRTLDGAIEVVARGDALPEFDLHCPLLSLPLAFKTELTTIPARTPYLRAPAGAIDWKSRLGTKRPRIGLVWSGNPGHKRDATRSIPFYALMPLLDIDASFVSLQKDVRASDAAVLKQTGQVIDVADNLTSFAETASLIATLDLVISVDTSAAHLTGALGKPLWLLLPQVPDWRWLMGRDDSPWYPTARLFRQDTTRAWGGVVARVRAALEDFVRRAA